MGDFSAHHPLWGSSKLNLRGQVVENILLHNNTSILNSKQSTYIHPATGSLSNIDLTLYSNRFFVDFSQTHMAASISQFFSRLISLYHLHIYNTAKSIRLTGLNSQQSCEHSVDNYISTIEQFSDTLVTIANKTILKTGISSHKIKNPWFTEECKKARKLRQKALHTLKAHPTSTNIEQFCITRGSCRRIMRQSERSSWRSYVSKINSNTPSRRIWNMLHKIHVQVKIPVNLLSTSK